MTQHAFTIANQNGAAFRVDVVNAFQAGASNNAGTSAPATTYANMWWPDTTTGWMKQRNSANSAWVQMYRLADFAFLSSLFALLDAGDNTKKAVLSLAGITAGATRTLTLQDKNLTLAGIDVAQLFTKPQRPYYTNTDAVSATGTFSYDGDTKGQICLIALTNAITVTFGAPANIVEGQPYSFLLKAGDASARTLAWNVAYQNSPPTSHEAASGKNMTLNFIGGAANTLIYNGGTAGA